MFLWLVKLLTTKLINLCKVDMYVEWNWVNEYNGIQPSFTRNIEAQCFEGKDKEVTQFSNINTRSDRILVQIVLLNFL